ncbi:MAG: prephenate dehydrogenase/arogenate dehydrogenase family protein [Candidatus Saccharimonadales bacterium]
MKQKIGIIGLSDFSRLIARELAPYFDIVISSRKDVGDEDDFRVVSKENVLKQSIIIPAIPSQFIEEFFVENKRLINPDALVVDVCSVKVKPVQVLQKVLPETCNILATHPMFGPFSGANGVKGLQMMIYPVRIENSRYEAIKLFLTQKLQLELVECTPDEHDKELVYVLGLTQLIGRAVDSISIPDTKLRTRAYDDLLDMKRIQGRDSWNLFESIVRDNPHFAEVIKSFIQALTKIENKVY